MKKRIHYAHRTEARWRTGRWLHIHGARFAVCISGPNAIYIGVHDNVTHDKTIVTCKRCLRIVKAIEENEKDPRPNP
jgi:hypothetical protein